MLYQENNLLLNFNTFRLQKQALSIRLEMILEIILMMKFILLLSQVSITALDFISFSLVRNIPLNKKENSNVNWNFNSFDLCCCQLNRYCGHDPQEKKNKEISNFWEKIELFEKHFDFFLQIHPCFADCSCSLRYLLLCCNSSNACCHKFWNRLRKSFWCYRSFTVFSN